MIIIIFICSGKNSHSMSVWWQKNCEFKFTWIPAHPKWGCCYLQCWAMLYLSCCRNEQPVHAQGSLLLWDLRWAQKLLGKGNQQADFLPRTWRRSPGEKRSEKVCGLLSVVGFLGNYTSSFPSLTVVRSLVMDFILQREEARTRYGGKEVYRTLKSQRGISTYCSAHQRRSGF